MYVCMYVSVNWIKISLEFRKWLIAKQSIGHNLFRWWLIACLTLSYCLKNWLILNLSWPHFYQTRSAWSVDQGSTRKCSAVQHFAPTVMKFCVMWEGLSLPHDTKFGNCRGEIADRRVIFNWSLIHGSSWSGLIKVGPAGTNFSEIWIWIQQFILTEKYIAVNVYDIFCDIKELITTNLGHNIPSKSQHRILFA